MARTLHVYPKAIIAGSTWTLIAKVGDSRFEHIVAAGITAVDELRLLKVGFDLVVDNTDTDQDVDDALFIDDIQPGPQVATVWGNWQSLAEGIFDPGDTEESFWSKWTQGDTQAVRNDMNRALVAGPGGIGRGWTVVTGSLHQHEGDGINTDG